MIKGLLARDPGKRLGSKAGAAELKKCDFLSEVNWKAIRHQNPPYIPPVVRVSPPPSPNRVLPAAIAHDALTQTAALFGNHGGGGFSLAVSCLLGCLAGLLFG